MWSLLYTANAMNLLNTYQKTIINKFFFFLFFNWPFYSNFSSKFIWQKPLLISSFRHWGSHLKQPGYIPQTYVVFLDERLFGHFCTHQTWCTLIFSPELSTSNTLLNSNVTLSVSMLFASIVLARVALFLFRSVLGVNSPAPFPTKPQELKHYSSYLQLSTTIKHLATPLRLTLIWS